MLYSPYKQSIGGTFLVESLKKHIIRSYVLSQSSEDRKNNRITFITPYGHITGFLVLRDEINPDDASYRLSRHAYEYVASYRVENELPLENSFEGDDGFMILKDVELKSLNGSITNYTELVVFYNQIIAFTIDSNNA